MWTSDPLRVTKVTVEYEVNGKSFTVDFNPANVRTIVFDPRYMRESREKRVGGRTRNARFHPEKRIPKVVSAKPANAKVARLATHAVAREPLPSATRESRWLSSQSSTGKPTARLWWLTSENVWFHPSGESE